MKDETVFADANLYRTVDSNGNVSWKASITEEDTYIANLSSKGYGVITNRQFMLFEEAFSNQALAAVSTGEIKLCRLCWEECSRDMQRTLCVHYCSMECLRCDAHRLELCEDVAMAIVRHCDAQYMDFHLLALDLMFNLATTQSFSHWQSIHQIHRLFDGDDLLINDSKINHEAELFLQALFSHGKKLVQKLYSIINLDSNFLKQLFRVVRLNAQSITLYSSKSHNVLCLLPSIPRMNHSCRPNCELVSQLVSLGNNSRARLIKVAVMIINETAPQQELCISYIANLYESTSVRRHLLQEGYCFECHCSRCDQEMPTPRQYTIELSTQIDQMQQIHQHTHSIPKRQDLLESCERAYHLISKSCSQGEVISIDAIYHGCLMVINDYQAILVQLLKERRLYEYVSYGVLCSRAMHLLCLCWSLVGLANITVRLELIASLCMHAALSHRKLLSLPDDVASSLGVVVDDTTRKAAAMGRQAREVLRRYPARIAEDQLHFKTGGMNRYFFALQSRLVKACSYLQLHEP